MHKSVDIIDVHIYDTESSQDVHNYCDSYHIKSVIVKTERKKLTVIYFY